MAIEVVKTYKEHLPAVRFVGKMYTDEDRVDNPRGGFNVCWTEWHKNGWMDILRKLPQIENIEKGPLGLMGIENKNGVHCNFQYWIGMMLPENTIVPDGFSYVDIPEGDVMVCGFMEVIKPGKYMGAMNYVWKKCLERKMAGGIRSEMILKGKTEIGCGFLSDIMTIEYPLKMKKAMLSWIMGCI